LQGDLAEIAALYAPQFLRHCLSRAGERRATLSASGSIIQFDNVGLRYGTGAETLSDLTFSLREGGFYFLTGPSGAGKTSLLKLLYLAQRPSRGLIRLFGEDIVTMPRKRPARLSSPHRGCLPGFPPGPASQRVRQCRRSRSASPASREKDSSRP
jgi:energy-coupling factor transporter ATP-binding protein EcfA2